jgi:hypothetical protein
VLQSDGARARPSAGVTTQVVGAPSVGKVQLAESPTLTPVGGAIGPVTSACAVEAKPATANAAPAAGSSQRTVVRTIARRGPHEDNAPTTARDIGNQLSTLDGAPS